MGTEPPQSAEELLLRYAAGERGFAGAHLLGADLSGVNLREANLSDTNLGGANLGGANLTNAHLIYTDFGEANLEGVNFSDANLGAANLERANLEGANLSGASLCGAHLLHADLSAANLSGVDLSDANLLGAYVSDANLLGASLTGANLTGANLTGANLTGVDLGETVLANIDLSPFCDVDPPVEHHAPSTVDFRSIIKSLHAPNLKGFLQRTGMPEVVIEALIASARQLQKESPGLLHSTFISYGGPDEAFARKLYEALQKNGVTTFFFPEHAVPGKRIGRTMRQGVNDFDRILLICSKDSLDRKGVLAEIEHSLSREDREGGAELVIPVVLDDYLFSGWNPANPDVLLTLKERVAADFRGWDTDPAKFDAGLRKLIGALKK